MYISGILRDEFLNPRSEGCDKWREIREREKVGKLAKKGPKRTILLEFIQLTTRCLPLSSSQYLCEVSTSTHFRLRVAILFCLLTSTCYVCFS
jgi:hypothetical protein